ncbi:hypothetical protein [Cryobacterium sp. N19]|uniref:hypothetical protein n=1 Tax=Cryobacterium sp. N19 TaxID=2048288 RepID=UPI001124E832|nr:hypothetical protein [Cryobacterium sp. N19]
MTKDTTTTTARFTPFRPGMDHLGFAVENIEELHRWAEYLTGATIEHGDLIEADYGTALRFKAPDDVALELFVSM